MNNLKELTSEQHRNAERQAFVKEMFSGTISNERYAKFLFNQHPQYNLLETLAMVHGLFDDMPELRRAPKIHEDYQDLMKGTEEQPVLLPVVKEYMDYLMSISEDPDRLMAHVYVRHMGDLFGGQMISKKVPGLGKMYQFDRDKDELKTLIRERVNDSMADEAKVCFEFATKLFQQMQEAKK